MLKYDFQYQHTDFNFNFNFNLNVELEMQQQLLGIVGASGCGKSTLLKNIVGLLQPSQGYIQFNQRMLVDSQRKINVPMHQRKIALIFQNVLLFPHMNVQQNLRYAEKLVSKPERKFQFEEVVELLELTPFNLSQSASTFRWGSTAGVDWTCFIVFTKFIVTRLAFNGSRYKSKAANFTVFKTNER